MIAPRLPSDFLERLRRMNRCQTLTVEFDPVSTEEKGLQCWSVYVMERGEVVWLCDWQGSLEGAVEALSQRIAKYDYARNGGLKYYAQKIDEKMARIREAKKRARVDLWRQMAGYGRRAFQAWADRRPDVGARGSG